MDTPMDREQPTRPLPETSFRDPRRFVRGPFLECPACGESAFGVLAIDGHCYWRRCKNCLHPQGKRGIAFPLPSIERKVVYLDQFAISLMMKSLHPDWASRQDAAQPVSWRNLFDHLDAAWRLNLVVCPASSFHWSESNATRHHIELRRLYKHFACGCHFVNENEIRLTQLFYHVKAWLKGVGDLAVPIKLGDVLRGDPSVWNDVFHVDIAYDRSLEFQERLRQERDMAHAGLQDTFDVWRDEVPTFEGTYRRELAGFGSALLKAYLTYRRRLDEVLAGMREPSLDDIHVPLSSRTPQFLFEVICVESEDCAVGAQKTLEYFQNADFSGVPMARLSSLLLACLSQRAAKGGQRQIGRGMINDINMVSSLLPYCDAMFLDREMHGLLKENDVCNRLGFPTKLFSAANLQDSFAYLDSLRDIAGLEHVQCVREVYGDDWLKPYAEIYR